MKRTALRILLALASTCVGVGLVEFGWGLVSRPDEPRGYLMFGGGHGSAFENVGRFFLYRPSSVIRVATYYETHDGPVREYEYEFHTNNLGLVQKDDVEAGPPSILLLGDSFTEGQGAEPWFEQVAPSFREQGWQPVNGGLVGTGPRQWILLDEHLRGRDIAIKKLIVILISDDVARRVWNFRPEELGCLSSYLACTGTERFVGMPPDALRAAFLERLGSLRDAEDERNQRWGATKLAMREARRLAGLSRRRLIARLAPDPLDFMTDPDVTRRIQYFVDRYGQDLIFVHLPARIELLDGMLEPGLDLRAAINASGAKFFDGFTRCGLSEADYYATDPHPNAAGYAKIAACVREAAKWIL